MSKPKRPLLNVAETFANIRRRTGMGREYALTMGRFGAAKFHWPLSSDEFEERTDAARPTRDIRLRRKWSSRAALEPLAKRSTLQIGREPQRVRYRLRPAVDSVIRSPVLDRGPLLYRRQNSPFATLEGKRQLSRDAPSQHRVPCKRCQKAEHTRKPPTPAAVIIRLHNLGSARPRIVSMGAGRCRKKPCA